MRHPIASNTTIAQATKHLSVHDDRLSSVIEAYGPCTIRPHSNYYQELVESIIGQQLSVKAAASINRRFVELFDGTFPTPEQILNKTVEALRSTGLSGAKARYVHDLALHLQNGTVIFDDFDQLDNQTIIDKLVIVKGIGEWTAHMFLIFCMGRLDVLATGDLGVRTGILRLYAIDTLPSPDTIRALATSHNWHPYESVACWYIWQSLDNSPAN